MAALGHYQPLSLSSGERLVPAKSSRTLLLVALSAVTILNRTKVRPQDIARDDFVPPKLQHIPEGHQTVSGKTHQFSFVRRRHNLPKKPHTMPDHQSLSGCILRSRLLLVARSFPPLRRRSDDPGRHPQGLAPAEPLELAVLQDTQQLRL